MQSRKLYSFKVICSLKETILIQERCEEIPPESLPVSDTIFSLKSDMPASEQFIFEETVEHTSNSESCSRYTICLLFGSRFHRQNSPQFTH